MCPPPHPPADVCTCVRCTHMRPLHHGRRHHSRCVEGGTRLDERVVRIHYRRLGASRDFVRNVSSCMNPQRQNTLASIQRAISQLDCEGRHDATGPWQDSFGEPGGGQTVSNCSREWTFFVFTFSFVVKFAHTRSFAMTASELTQSLSATLSAVVEL